MNQREYAQAIRDKYNDQELARTIEHLQDKRDLATHELRTLSAMRKALKLEQREDDAAGSDQGTEESTCEVDGERSGSGDA